MVSRVVACVSLMLAVMVTQAGIYWYGFGIWPKNWWALIAFTILQAGLTEVFKAVAKERA